MTFARSDVSSPTSGQILGKVDWAAESRRIANRYRFASPSASVAFQTCVAGCLAVSPPLEVAGIPGWVKLAGIGLGVYLLARK